MTNKALTQFKDVQDLKAVLANQYQKQIVNFLGDEKKALRFLSGVVAACQRTPKLLECSPESLINSFIIMAELGLMPSGVSGEAYVLPYNSKQGMQAQFQLGYQGLVTLFYRAGVRSITSEIVFEHDKFEIKNGLPEHSYDAFQADRGKPRGAYVIVELQAGGLVSKVMSEKEILEIAQKFSKSFKTFGPWSEGQDPQRWMWKKTVLKQCAKLVPKNETIFKAVAEDNKDSIIGDRLDGAKKESAGLAMGNLLKDGKTKNKKAEGKEQDQDGLVDAESFEGAEEGEIHID